VVVEAAGSAAAVSAVAAVAVAASVVVTASAGVRDMSSFLDRGLREAPGTRVDHYTYAEPARFN